MWLAIVAAAAAGGACGSDDDGPGNTAGSQAGNASGGSGGGAGVSAGHGGSSGAGGSTSGGGGDAGSSGGAGSSAAGSSAAGSSGAGSSGAAGSGGATGERDASADAAASADGASSDGRGDAAEAAAPRDGGSLLDGAVEASANDGGALAYNPCPAKGTPCKIMPLGDSITQDVSTSAKGGYRIPLLRKARTAMQTITFVGSNKTGPTTLDGLPFPQDNEGHSGWTIDDAVDGSTNLSGLYPKIAGWIGTAAPHIVTLMIGTNDANRQVDLPIAPTRLGKLIDRIVETDPKVLLVVAQIIPSRDDAALNARIRTYNAAIPALVQARAAAGKHVVIVDMYNAFTKNSAFASTYFDAGSNGVLHPNEAGYVVMADVWYGAIGELLR